jgi:hypothetical protein
VLARCRGVVDRARFQVAWQKTMLRPTKGEIDQPELPVAWAKAIRLSSREVWLTEKDRDGATHLYPLTDFKPRPTENLQRGYLQGRYGAIPFIDSLDLTSSLRSEGTDQVRRVMSTTPAFPNAVSADTHAASTSSAD